MIARIVDGETVYEPSLREAARRLVMLLGDRDLSFAGQTADEYEELTAAKNTLEAIVSGYRCPTCKSLGLAPHECPYNAEINDDASLCECCTACRQECVWNI